MSKIDVMWAETQNLNYLLSVVEATNEQKKEKKKATNGELSRALVD